MNRIRSFSRIEKKGEKMKEIKECSYGERLREEEEERGSNLKN